MYSAGFPLMTRIAWLLAIACLSGASPRVHPVDISPAALPNPANSPDSVQLVRPGFFLPGPFNPIHAFYSLVTGPGIDTSAFNQSHLMVWPYPGICRSVPDLMHPDEHMQVPYATNYMYLSDFGRFETASGAMFNWLLLNTTEQQIEPGSHGRWDGGTLGIAVFSITDSGAVLTWFDPFIVRIGSFGNIPALESWQVIHDSLQFVSFIQKMSGNGWPEQRNLFVLALDDSGVHPALMLDFYERDNASHGNWSSAFSWKIPAGEPVLEVVSHGDACSGDWREGENIPATLQHVEGNRCNKQFTLYRRYRWNGNDFSPLPDSVVFK